VALLADPKLSVIAPETLRSLRAIQTLALIGISEAEPILRELAKGAAEMLVTKEASKRIEVNSKRGVN
jgi:hypothetical protein